MAAAKFNEAKRAREFIAAGNAIVTLRSRKSGEHFTYRVRAPRDRRVEGGAHVSTVKLVGPAPVHFVSVLAGPDNNADYQYIGYIRDGKFVHGGEKSRAAKNAPSVVAFGWSWTNIAHDRLPEALDVLHEGRCGRCGRRLTVPASIESGLGPECAGRS